MKPTASKISDFCWSKFFQLHLNLRSEKRSRIELKYWDFHFINRKYAYKLVIRFNSMLHRGICFDVLITSIHNRESMKLIFLIWVVARVIAACFPFIWCCSTFMACIQSNHGIVAQSQKVALNFVFNRI